MLLITGASGQLGRDFQKLLLKKDIDFIASDVVNSPVNIDITNLQQLRDFMKKETFSGIINCAAYNAVDNAEKDWNTAYMINGIGTRNLSLVAKENNAFIVHYSTDYVFDGKKGSPYTILDNPNPISNYGKSKYLGEKYLNQIGGNYYLIRTSWVFGEGNVNFIKKLLDWSKNDSLNIVTDESSSPTFTVDLAKASYDLIQTKAFGLYHITNSDHCSRFDLAKHVLEKINWEGSLKPAKLKDFNLPANRPKFSVLDNFGTKETIGYSLPSWKNAVNRFLENREVHR